MFPANAYESAINAEVLKEKDIEPVKDGFIAIKPMKAAFDRNYAKRLNGENTTGDITRWEMTERLREDIRRFKEETGVERAVAAGPPRPRSMCLWTRTRTPPSNRLKRR